MKLTSLITPLALAAAIGAGQGVAAQDPGGKEVTITGCAVKGNGDGDGFLLANAVERTTTTTTTPTPTGAVVSSTATTALGPSRVLYWLDDDDDVVEKFMGQQVEIVGKVEGDIEKGNIRAEREAGMVELEIKGDGHKATVKLPEVPSAVGTAGAVGDREKKIEYVVRKLDVKSARSIAPTCQ